MTAIKTVTLNTGIMIEDAIHRIESVNLGYKNTMTYTVRQYASLDKPFFGEFKLSTNYNGGDVYHECYINLMASGDYTEA